MKADKIDTITLLACVSPLPMIAGRFKEKKMAVAGKAVAEFNHPEITFKLQSSKTLATYDKYGLYPEWGGPLNNSLTKNNNKMQKKLENLTTAELTRAYHKSKDPEQIAAMAQEFENRGRAVPKRNDAPKESTAAKKDAAKKAPKKKAAPKKKGPGVIESIYLAIANAKKPISEAQILAQLKKRFPDRQEKSMIGTIRAQIGTKKRPTRMERERNIEFEITENKSGKRLFFLPK